MMESERCELVLNAVFYWEPVEFFQLRCDMIRLRVFQDKPCGVVLDLLYARDLFYRLLLRKQHCSSPILT